MLTDREITIPEIKSVLKKNGKSVGPDALFPFFFNIDLKYFTISSRGEREEVTLSEINL